MNRDEICITTAKEIFLKIYTYQITETTVGEDLKRIDKVFKAITKTVTESYLESVRAK